MSTASLCCAALAAAGAAGPGARGGERRLVPGRRAAATSAGFRGVAGFATLSTMGKAAPAPPKPKVTMLACAKATKDDSAGRTGDSEHEEFDKFYAVLCEETECRFRIFKVPHVALPEEEIVVQNNLKEIAQRCMDLQADAMRRLRPEQRRPLYPLFRTVHVAFASVKFRAMAGRAFLSWIQASLLFVEKLDVVRRMISSACGAPLPLDREACLLPPIVLEEDPLNLGVKTSALPQVVAFAVIEYTYNTIKSDIDKMITASSSATSTSS